MQLTLNIENEESAEKILWFLEHFKKDGLEIKKSKSKVNEYSEEYLKEHWRELIMTHEDPEIDDDDKLLKKSKISNILIPVYNPVEFVIKENLK